VTFRFFVFKHRKSHGTLHFALEYSPPDRKAKLQMTQHVETLGILEEEQDVLRRAKDHFFPSVRGSNVGQGGLRRSSLNASASRSGGSSSPKGGGGGGSSSSNGRAPRARRPALSKPKEYEYEVRVHVHQARDLPVRKNQKPPPIKLSTEAQAHADDVDQVKDTDTHSSDPYLKATIAGQEARTATKPQNLNPQWYDCGAPLLDPLTLSFTQPTGWSPHSTGWSSHFDAPL
jgi:hypothetical protein